MSGYLINMNDFIIDSEQIHIVSKIDNDRIFYYPMTKDSSKGNITSSIPLNNLERAGIRPLMTVTETKQFLKKLATEEPLDIPEFTNRNNNSNSLKEVLYLNDPIKTGRLLIYFCRHQAQADLSRFDQSIFDQALKHLAEEIATVCKITFDVAKKQVLSAIKK
jgi:RNA polymerase-interacting CarD/CdnL/TRCF family regulator